MATKIDLGAVANNAINTLFGYLNKRIGGGNSPLNNQNDQSAVKIGNVGGIFGINLNWTTLALIGAGIFGIFFIVKKVK